MSQMSLALQLEFRFYKSSPDLAAIRQSTQDEGQIIRELM